MSFLHKLLQSIFRKPQKAVPIQTFIQTAHTTSKQSISFSSKYCNHTYYVDLFLPPSYASGIKKYPCVYFNDGQDMEALKMQQTLDQLYLNQSIQEVIVIAIHAADRMQDYGTARQADYKNRGSKAALYTQFIINELMPLIRKDYLCNSKKDATVIAGFSLGGLSALDIAWNNSATFGKVGAFSASLWWRSKSFNPNAPDADRIMHQIISEGPKKDGLKFWLQAGTNDEKSDRNNNGIIDAIDDTLDLMKQLTLLGYKEEVDYTYIEVQNGEHNQKTWGQIMPTFLKWAFPPTSE